MKKILIINLRRLGDVYSTAHLVNSLSQSMQCEVSMLVFKESRKAACNIKNVKNIFTIDREEIITIMNNKLFTDACALDRIYESLKEIQKQEWDIAINFSNDTTSAYLCSYLKPNFEKIIGVHFNSNRNIKTNTVWDIIFNDVITSLRYSPMHFIDCYHRMLNIPVAMTGQKLITNHENDDTALVSISNIRNGQTPYNPNAKVIGIQISTSTPSKNIDLNVLVQYINYLKESNELIPLLLIAPTEEEKILANRINLQFDNNLIVVESDLSALASVVQNLDLIVTPDTVTKHIADLTDSPVLEISLGESPFLKQGSYNVGSLILTDMITCRNFSKSNQNSTSITAEDIFASTIYYFSNSKNIRPVLSKNVSLYKIHRDSMGTTYLPCAGSHDSFYEIQRLMSRQYITYLFDNSESMEIYDEIIKIGIHFATEWCNKEKAIITEMMKDLLGTLRALLQSLETKRNSRDFIIGLGKLLSHSEIESASQVASIVFKSKLEAINAKTFEENAKEVESLLYEFKSYIQKNLKCIKSLEEKISDHKKEDFMQRSNQTVG